MLTLKTVTFLLFLSSLAQAALLPSSDSNFHRLTVEHPDGQTGTIHLEKYFLNDEERMLHLAGNSNEHCRFTGYLASDPEGSCVAMTGCPGDETVELTVLSQKFGNALLVWKADGSVENVPHPYAAVSIIPFT